MFTINKLQMTDDHWFSTIRAEMTLYYQFHNNKLQTFSEVFYIFDKKNSYLHVLQEI